MVNGVVPELAAQARAAGRLGIDTEFMGEGRYRALLCLVQVAVETPDGVRVEVLDPLTEEFDPAPLAAAPRIKDYDSWYTVWLEVAKKAEAEKRWLDAASYYHGAEFYLPAGDLRNGLYDDFARNWALGMKGVTGYERIAMPYPGGTLPGFRLQAKGKERSTLIFTGGYDSFMEEFYNFLLPLTELGITVIAFDGPGQGGALRQGIYLDHAWEKPAKAAIDYFKLDAVDW